jgi:nickel-dependent lactate racemase
MIGQASPREVPMDVERVRLAYGKESVEFDVPRAFLAGPVLDTRKSGASQKPPAEEIAEALSIPFARSRLCDMAAGRSVGIVISDEFRAGLQKEIAEALVAEVMGGRPSELRVLVATGSHDPFVYARNLRPHIEKIISGLPVPAKLVLHDCDKSEFVGIGQTPGGTQVLVNREWLCTDLRVYGHESKHHYMAGYSTVDKQIIPGLSARRTIEKNHKNSLDHENAFAGRSPWHAMESRRFNPFAIDAREGRKLSERHWLSPDGRLVERAVDTFALDMVSEKDTIFWVRAGNPDLVTQEMTGVADKLGAYEVEKTRYVVVSPGGPPASQAMYGVQNCFDMALKGAIEDGGEALVIAPCEGREDLPPEVRGLAPDAKSKALFWDNLVRFRDVPLDACASEIDRIFELYLWKTDRVLKLFKANRVKIHVYCGLDAGLLESAGFQKAESIQAWVNERAARGDGKLRVINNGNKLFVTPAVAGT